MCRDSAVDVELTRVRVWEDAHWRLSTGVEGDYTPGFSYLEPKRHIPHITDLDGPEAATFGAVLARCTAALQEVTGAELVYVYIFGGGVAHLHVHLAPHTTGDALHDSILRGNLAAESTPDGLTRLVSTEFDVLPAEQLHQVAERLRMRLAEG